MNEQLKTELEEMYETDQRYRGELLDRDAPSIEERNRMQQETDERNIARLIEVIEEHGWPGSSMVGNRGAAGAFLVLQHADYAYQKKYLPLAREAVAAGEMQPQLLPLLEDRVLMREGRKQIYGSQLHRGPEGGYELWPIEDEASVDERRAEVGLKPLADYLKGFGLEYVPGESE